MARRRRTTRHVGTPTVNGMLTGADKVNGRGGGTHTFVTQKGWCTPSRIFIEKAYRPLGIKAKFGAVELQYEKDEDGNERPVPTDQVQTVTVNESQADWAEYVLGAVCGQVPIRVISGIRNRGNFNRGKARRGVPMPWLYDAMGEVPKDDVKTCVSKLPKDQRKAAEEAMERGEVDVRMGGPGMRFTHEGRGKGQGGRKGPSTSQKATKTRKRSQGRPGASRKAPVKRGSHRGRHRGR